MPVKTKSTSTISRLEKFMCSTYNVFITKRICSCHLHGINVRPRFQRTLVMRKSFWHSSYFMQRRNIPDEDCYQRADSTAYLMLKMYLCTQFDNRLLPSLSNRNCCIGEMHMFHLAHLSQKQKISQCAFKL